MNTAITNTSASRILARYLDRRTAYVIEDAPQGVAWGWWPPSPPRMHLVSIDPEHQREFTVYLEDRGRRVFDPESNVPADIANALRDRLVVERPRVEAAWTRRLILRNLIKLQAHGRFVLVVAYGGLPGEFLRVIDMADLIPERVDLDDRNVAIDVDPTEIVISPVELAGEEVRIPLAGVLWR